MPKYTAHPRPPQDFYRLLYGRSPYHTFGRTRNKPILTKMMPENEVWVHPSVADYWGIKNGDRIKLKNTKGVVSNHIKVRITQRIRKDCVYMVHGFGHTQKQMMRSYLKGADDNDLMTTVMVDPIMGGTGMRGNFVTFKI
jgi:thiosulfate reductase/polysulfide reductase chain A